MGVLIPIAELEAYINQQFPASVGHIPLRESCNAAALEVETLRKEVFELTAHRDMLIILIKNRQPLANPA